jgi:cytochrome c peroxidase
MRKLIFFFLLVGILSGCTEEGLLDRPISFKQPPYFPKINFPEGNEPTQLRFELGKKLFYEKQLSKNDDQSCASCHRLPSAFTDGRTVSSFHENEFARNAPTLANLAWSPYFMSEGGVPTLELQALGPIHEKHELSLSMQEVIDRLKSRENYNELSKAAYGRELDAFSITRALACFERALISGDSKFDRYYFLKSNDYSELERQGMELFFSERTQCSSCHALPFFTDYKFYSLGLEDADIGLERRTYLETDKGKFKTPSLRNIELTAPYMHNGSMSSLEEVVSFYNNGGGARSTKDSRVKPLNLSIEEEAQLVAFLKTLTDWNFVQHEKFLVADED